MYDYEKADVLVLSKYSLRKHSNFLLQDAIAASCSFPIAFKHFCISILRYSISQLNIQVRLLKKKR